MNPNSNESRVIALLSLFLLLAIGAIGEFFVAAPIDPIRGGPINPADVSWILTATGLVLLMTPGLSFFYGGMVDSKSVISTMFQSFICMGVVSLLWVIVGFSLAFGDSVHGFIGNPATYFMFRGVGGATHPDLSPTIPLALFALFQLKFCIITPALITGAFAERVRFKSYLLFIILFSLVIYPPLAHWTWHPNGILRKWGVLDYAGGTVVHISAGLAALAGALYLGRRKKHRAQGHLAPANIPFVLLGTGMLWFGWFGFNAGSALAANEAAVSAFLTTNTASAAAMVAWIFFDMFRGRRPSAMAGCVGAVVGLVAITPAAGFVTVGQSLIIGVLAAMASNLAAHWKSQSRLDDTLDVFPCHGVGGMVGMVLTGVFADKVGLIHGGKLFFAYQCLGMLIATAFAFFASLALYKVCDWLIPLRVSVTEESVGLDISQHGESVSGVHSAD